MPSIGIIKPIKPSKIEPMPPRTASNAIIVRQRVFLFAFDMSKDYDLLNLNET